MSLVMPYELNTMRNGGRGCVQPGHIVRFSVGLEAVENLEQDLAQAYAKAFGLSWKR